MTKKRRYLLCAFVLMSVLGAALYHNELGQIWAGIYQRYFLSEAERARQKEEALRQEAAAFFACKPEKPLSREKLFARAMQNYWRREMERLWALDKALGEDEFPPVTTDITDNTCGLVRDKRGNPLTISRDTCYPWKITEYDTLEKLRTRIQDVPDLLTEWWSTNKQASADNTYDIIVREILRGQVIHPERELPYSPEDLKGGRAGFAIIRHDGPGIWWYEPDCCKLMTYGELPEKDRKSDPFWISPYLRYLPPGTRIEDVMFLTVMTYPVDTTWPNGRNGTLYLDRGELYENYPITFYFIVSPCGAID